MLANYPTAATRERGSLILNGYYCHPDQHALELDCRRTSWGGGEGAVGHPGQVRGRALAGGQDLLETVGADTLGTKPISDASKYVADNYEVCGQYVVADALPIMRNGLTYSSLFFLTPGGELPDSDVAVLLRAKESGCLFDRLLIWQDAVWYIEAKWFGDSQSTAVEMVRVDDFV